MQEKVMEQVQALEMFFTTHDEAKNLNVTQEVLFTLMQMVDLRDDTAINAQMIKRLSFITGQIIRLSEPFFQEYFTQTSTFVMLYIQSVSETMHSTQEWELQNMMQECSTFLASKLPQKDAHRIMQVTLRELIDKVNRLATEPSFSDEEIIPQMQAQLNDENLDNLSMLEPSQSIAMVLGSVIGLLSVMSQKEGMQG